MRVVTARDLFTSSVVLLRLPYNIVIVDVDAGLPAIRPHPRRRGTKIVKCLARSGNRPRTTGLDALTTTRPPVTISQGWVGLELLESVIYL